MAAWGPVDLNEHRRRVFSHLRVLSGVMTTSLMHFTAVLNRPNTVWLGTHRRRFIGLIIYYLYHAADIFSS